MFIVIHRKYVAINISRCDVRLLSIITQVTHCGLYSINQDTNVYIEELDSLIVSCSNAG